MAIVGVLDSSLVLELVRASVLSMSPHLQLSNEEQYLANHQVLVSRNVAQHSNVAVCARLSEVVIFGWWREVAEGFRMGRGEASDHRMYCVLHLGGETYLCQDGAHRIGSAQASGATLILHRSMPARFFASNGSSIIGTAPFGIPILPAPYGACAGAPNA